jgi:hypothetical protein
MIFSRRDPKLNRPWSICATCIGYCVVMLAEDLGGQWNNYLKLWPEAAED